MSSGLVVADNLAIIAKGIQQAAQNGANFISFPEICNVVDKNKQRLAPQLQRPEEDITLQTTQQLAKQYNIFVHLGSLVLLAPDSGHKLLNRAYFIGNDGAIIGYYDKIHLYDVDLPNGERHRESDFFTAGGRACIVNAGGVKMGLSICYDLRFPALYRQLCQGGAELLFVPACFTALTGSAHWESLLRARAIENSCFVVAAAQNGPLADGRTTHGHSMIIDPWGRVLVNAGQENGLYYAMLDLNIITQTRNAIPAWQYD